MKIGPVSARFAGKVTLSDMDPPNGYRISGEGQGGAAGFAKGGAVVKLAEADSVTILTYTADAQVGGKIAQIGARLIDGTARKLADEFFGKFTEVVGGPPAPPGAAPAEPALATAGERAAPTTRSATDSAERGYKHWLLIGAGIAILVIAYFAVR